jgi:hypothetical protein
MVISPGPSFTIDLVHGNAIGSLRYVKKTIHSPHDALSAVRVHSMRDE